MPDHQHHSSSTPDPATELLLQAFESNVRTQGVDERELMAGTRAKMQRHRRTRRLQVLGAALVLTAAVPIAISSWPATTVSTAPAGQGASAPSSPVEANPAPPSPSASTAPAPTTAPAPAPTPTSKLANPNIPVAYDIPDMTAVAATVPVGMTLALDNGQYPRNPSVMGQTCSSASFDPPQIAGRQFSWLDEGSQFPQQQTVDLVVTGWQSGGGPTAFNAVATASGVCRFTDDVAPFDLTIDGADQTWAAEADFNGATRISGVVRVGDLLAGVTLSSPQDGPTDLAALLTAAAADLRASGLPAVNGK